MLYSINKREDLENLHKVISSENQAKAVQLQDKLGKKNFYEDKKNVFQPVTKSIKDVSEEVRKTMTKNSVKNDKALENINDKLSELMNDRGIKACSFLSPLSKISNPKNTSQFKKLEDPNSIRVNNFLPNRTLPVTQYNNLFTISDTDKKFELHGDLLKVMTNKNYNVDLANLSKKKLMYDFAKETFFDEKKSRQ